MDSPPQYQFIAAVARAVEEARTASGLSVLELADKSQIPRGTLQRRLLADSAFTSKELYQLAGVLGVTPSHFLLTAERGAA